MNCPEECLQQSSLQGRFFSSKVVEKGSKAPITLSGVQTQASDCFPSSSHTFLAHTLAESGSSQAGMPRISGLIGLITACSATVVVFLFFKNQIFQMMNEQSEMFFFLRRVPLAKEPNGESK